METVALLVQPEQRWVLSAWEPIDHVGDAGPLGFWHGMVKRLRMHGGLACHGPCMHALVGKLMRDCGKAGLFYSFFFLPKF